MEEFEVIYTEEDIRAVQRKFEELQKKYEELESDKTRISNIVSVLRVKLSNFD